MRLRRRAVLALLAGATVAAVPAAVTACGRKSAQGSGGGEVTPSPIRITLNPSAPPIGDTMPTGIVIDGVELVLYIWQSSQTLLYPIWYDHAAGAVTDEPRYPGTGLSGEPGSPAQGDGHFTELVQLAVGDGTLIEYGVVLGAPARITVADDGRNYRAWYTRWSADRRVTVWWLRRSGVPVPRNVPDGAGGRSPLPADRYPLVTAVDGDGATIGWARLRPGWSRPPTDG